MGEEGSSTPNLLPGRDTWEVPAFRATELTPRRTRYCVCVFVLNEGARIHTQLRRMQAAGADLDVILADGGSTDGSTSPDVLRTLNVRTLLVKTGPGKLSAQMRMAYAYALDQGYGGVVTVDGNNKDDPAALPAFTAALDAGYDHVQGSRFVPGGREINTPLHRRFAVALIHAPMISLSAGRRHTDTTNGFRAYSKRLLTDPRIAPFRDVFTRYELHYYLAIRASRLGMRLTEVPVTRAYPSGEPTPTKISGIRGYAAVLRQLLMACLHRYDPPSDRPVAEGGWHG